MKLLLGLVSIGVILQLGGCFSKYGRTCKDIGCGSNEMCVMAQDPCTGYSEQCGSYPTCRKVSNEGPSCTRYFCPPTTVCKLDGDTPKCVDDDNSRTPDRQKSFNSYAGYNDDASGSDANNGGNANQVYPVLPGQTTSRPVIRRPGAVGGGGGYDGGSRGSGYPTQGGGSYPSQGGSYPSQGGSYPSQGGSYPSQGGSYSGSYQGGYNQGGGGYSGYPTQGGAGYQGGGYQGGYQQNRGGYPQGGYNQGGYGQGNTGYGQKPSSSSASNPVADIITGTLKTWGTNILKNALSNIKL